MQKKPVDNFSVFRLYAIFFADIAIQRVVWHAEFESDADFN